ncbi:MAG: L-lactate permease [Chloroflexi bacterium]|nr:L-lactate permease [Chloroflexota bacterium]
MDYNAIDWLLSLLPMLAVLGLMVGRGWKASQAGFVGWLAAVLLAVGRFGAGLDALGYAQIKALILTVDVLLIIWAALVLYYVVERAGALTVIADNLSSLSADPLVQVLLLGWVFTSFLQGVGGFGVPVAIVAPLLVGLGISQVRAVVIPSVGHGWAVTFGSLAASFVMLINTTGRAGEDLVSPPAIMLGVLAYVSGLMIAHVLDGWRGVRRAIPFVLVAGTVMAVVQYLLAISGLWTLGTIGAGLAGLVVSVLWIRRGQRTSTNAELGPAQPADNKATPASSANPRPRPTLRLALAGYTILVVLAVLMRGVAPVKGTLNRWALEIDLPETTTDRDWTVEEEQDEGFGIPGHPGLIIFYSSGIAYILYRRRKLYAPGVGRDILKQSGQRAWKSGLGVLMMVAIASTMGRAGMTEIIADGLSESIPGSLYAFVAPVIGAIGAFVTGSNTNSNAVFGMLQLNTAEMLGVSVATILGAQTASGAVASVLAPAKVTVGCSTVDANEGVVLRWLLGYGALLVALVGVMTWIGVVVLD